MKNLYILSLLAASVSFAQATDPFNGAPGTALNAAGWFTHSGATPGQDVIVAGSISYPGLPSTGNKTQIVSTNSEDVNLPSAAPITGAAYYSAVINVLNTTGLAANTDTSGSYFMHMAPSGGASIGTAFQGKLFIKAGVAADTYTLGILNTAGTMIFPTFVASDYPINTPMFVVVKYDIASNTASLFVNPAIGGSEGTAAQSSNLGTAVAPTQIGTVAIRQASNTGNIELDNVRLGSSWEYVTSATLGVKQNTAIAGLKVYPNPVKNGNLFITSDNTSAKSVAIYDVLGKQVMNTVVENGPVNVANLQSGVYIVKITEDGKTASRKLVIE